MAGPGRVARSNHTRAVLAVLVCSVTLAACGQRQVASFRSPTMPDPGGCYVLVYEHPEFRGAWEYINGPRRYAILDDLPFRSNWRRRIRSVHVGPTASVTMWASESFEGAGRRFPANARLTTLEALSGQIESLDVQCQRT